MKIKGVIFDLDGILVETEYYQWQGWVKALKPFGIKFSKHEYLPYAGKASILTERSLIEKYKLKVKSGVLVDEKEKLILKWLKEKNLKSMPYAKEAVKFFVDKKLKVAVATSGPIEETALKLKKTGLYTFFKVIVSKNDVKIAKPHPDIYLTSTKKLGVKPNECIAFEDSQYGVESAKAAGLICLAIPSEFSLKQDFSKADKVFPNMKEAVEYVKKYIFKPTSIST